MNDPVLWVALAAVLSQGATMLFALRVIRKFGDWTEELRRERRAADLLARSNQHVVDLLARVTHTTPAQLQPIAADDSPDDEERSA